VSNEMPQDMKIKLKTQLIKHEGCKHFPYIDSVGKITIGIGVNLTDRGISNDWIDSTFNDDADGTYKQLMNKYPWFSELTMNRQIALIDMCWFGIKKFEEFTKTIAALEVHNYAVAAHEIINSEYRNQVGNRAFDIAHTILTDIL
jgi:lysozyme